MAATLKVLGVSDDVTGCECCGRQGLKRTVAIGDSEGNVRYFGTDCAAQALGCSDNDINKGIRVAIKTAKDKAARERVRLQREQSDRYDAWKLATFGDIKDSLDRIRQYRATVVA